MSSFSYFPVAAARADELDLTGKAFIKHREKLKCQRQLKDEVKQTALAKETTDEAAPTKVEEL